MNNGDYFDCNFLKEVLPEAQVDFDKSVRERYASDASVHSSTMPDAVVSPRRTTEVASVLSAANDRGVPVTPYSGGSSLEGNAIPVRGGIVLNMAELTSIDVDAENLQVTVGPGVVYDDLNDALEPHRLQFPPGISSSDVATIGGMIANNASGANAVRYGETRDHVRRLEVVLPDGRTIQCGRNVVKTSAGYSLKDLFIGSEGTLGVVTEATLSLTSIPTRKRSAVVTFDAERDACRAVSEIIQSGLKPGAIEYVDAESVGYVNEYTGLGLEPTPTLLVELHGNNDGIDDDVSVARSICEDNDALSWVDEDGDRMEEIWQARRNILYAYEAHREEWSLAADGDVVVPIARYPDIVKAIERIADHHDIPIPVCGHAGDGNLHYSPLVDVDDEDSVQRVDRANQEIIEAAIEMGGTSTGEHGIGLGKTEFLETEHGEAVEIMQMIKESLDPNGVMNPGKVLPEP
ncbi:FAD-binding protein [Halorubrum sp. CBA1125]|uniref:FAD-binding oxidoreductase n=1 Tax=Halorubrum sp. CBA1125 TaxID=2668072 RepID=UPI0012E79CE9|nr:FAD-binding oxidoreductase [Halorubrum sp. CBA1125]MUW13698.1 FAD-binding protein [Halorubrum sp. CBA1125]